MAAGGWRRRRLLAVGLALVVALAVAAVISGRRGDRTKTETATVVSVIVGEGAAADVVYLAGSGDGCGEPAGVQVEERDDEVVFTARIRYAASREGRVCSLVGTHRRETVTLRRPLGSRRVIDGSNGQVVPRAPVPPTPPLKG